MVLNYIWIAFFLVAFIVAIVKTFMGDMDVFAAMVQSTFDMAEVSFEISIGLTGILCLWLGIMKIGENGGSVQALSRLVGPFFSKLFPDVPADHPARGSMLMNFSANMLGLDNAATPMGLKAMNELQELNPDKKTASNAQIMFLVLNTSGLTLIPITVMNYRSQYGAEDPSDVFLPILIATFFASLVGLITVAIYQKINLFNKVIIAYLGGLTAVIIAAIFYFKSLHPEDLQAQSSLISSVILYGIICLFIIMALRKKVNVYDSFIEGAKDGFGVAIKIIPYLVAIIVSIGVFRASGSMDLLIAGIGYCFSFIFNDIAFVAGLPTALMKPLSGSGARGLMLESFSHHGVDSFVGKLTSTLQGATDTTFYIIAVYFGSVGIRNTRYAIKAGLLADFAGIVAGIIVAYMFFGSAITGLTNKQTVEEFTSYMSTGDIQHASEYLGDNIVIFNNSFDTVCVDKNGALAEFFTSASTTATLIEELDEDNKPLLIKTNKKVGSEIENRNYKATVKNGKITSIEILTFYENQSTY
jgi:spore maturation protein SpmA/spore maturation protein SpmB